MSTLARRLHEPPATGDETDIDVLKQLGIDPIDIHDLSERQMFELAQRVNAHTTRWMIRRAIATGELRGIRRGKKFLYSRRELARWMQAGSDALADGQHR
ncbi:helix-turn-helix domain-containing protein [Rhodococcus sp. UNC23MFCrub1.1]|uniref:helix-turn-helix domain-containing protein n=1 Tax=Rhodococcus sp. UNC23MFCrub1.1 TaxID=1449068 RepID=UPI0012DF7D0D|nr:helix-turn-helix domain-containing protein [Rhodococcus sp. UNC23MFCrub1.1]